MTDESLEFVQSALDTHPNLPAGISVTCEYNDDGNVTVTFAKEDGKTATFIVRGRESMMLDSDAFNSAVNDRVIAARDKLNPRDPPKKKRARKAKAVQPEPQA